MWWICQLIRQQNETKRLDHTSMTISVMWLVRWDDSSNWNAQMLLLKPRPKPHPKQPIKVHVWAGISKQGATQVCIFIGKKHWYRSYRKNFPHRILIASCRTMTLPEWRRHSHPRTTSTGDEIPQNLWTWTLSKISGMSSRSSFEDKSNRRPVFSTLF